MLGSAIIEAITARHLSPLNLSERDFGFTMWSKEKPLSPASRLGLIKLPIQELDAVAT